MPKYLLLEHYRGGPEPHRPVPPMDQWARGAELVGEVERYEDRRGELCHLSLPRS